MRENRYAVVDIGSNTMKMNIYDVDEVDSETTLSFIMTESSTLGLINYNSRKMMSEAGIGHLVETLEKYKRLAENVGVAEERIFCLATASLRNIINSAEVIAAVKARTGLDTSLISGENEALLGFDGLRYALGESVRSGVMCDIGGGSTELLGFIDCLAVRAHSDKFGCLSLYRKFVEEIFPSKKEAKQIAAYVAERVGKIDWLSGYGDTLYLVGGTARSVAKLRDEMTASDGTQSGSKMTSDQLLDTIDYFTHLNKDKIEILIKVIPDRLHTIVTGMIALEQIVKRVQAKNIVISSGGLREGYLLGRIREMKASQGEENG